jgi:hypothetical protein
VFGDLGELAIDPSKLLGGVLDGALGVVDR